MTAVSASHSAIASFVVRTFGSKKGNNGGSGEVSSLGVNEACKFLAGTNASKETGAKQLLGSGTLDAIKKSSSKDGSGDGGSGEDVLGMGWEVCAASMTKASGQITYDGKAAIWRALDSLGINYAHSNVDHILASDECKEIQEQHQLSRPQIKRQIDNYIKEKKNLPTIGATRLPSRLGATIAPITTTSGNTANASSSNGGATSNNTTTDSSSSNAPTFSGGQPTKSSKRRVVPFGARVELGDLFTKRNINARDSFPSTDRDVNVIMSKYDISLPEAKAELAYWRKRGGQLRGVELEGLTNDKINRDMRDKMQISQDEFAMCTLTDVCSGSSQAVSSFGVPVRKLVDWQPGVVYKMQSLLDSDSPHRDDIVSFWSNIAFGMYRASIKHFALSADAVETQKRGYQKDIRNLREEKGSEWCQGMDGIIGENWISKKDAYSFFIFTFYFMLQQFTYMAKYGGEGTEQVIEVKLNDTSVLTENAKVVLYYLSGWVAHAIGEKRVTRDLVNTYTAFKTNNTVSEEAAAKFALPTWIVEQRKKRQEATLHYAAPRLYDFLKNVECVFRKHGNQRGFARYGGDLFKVIERTLVESKELYEELFRPCMYDISCEEETSQKIYEAVISMYTNMRAKYLIKSEKAREAKVGNQTFTTLQEIEVCRRVAKARADILKKTEAELTARIATAQKQEDEYTWNLPDHVWDDLDAELQILVHA